jgi:hypothetical protein
MAEIIGLVASVASLTAMAKHVVALTTEAHKASDELKALQVSINIHV